MLVFAQKSASHTTDGATTRFSNMPHEGALYENRKV